MSERVWKLQATRMSRLEFFQRTITAAGVLCWDKAAGERAGSVSASELIDVNVYLSRWPLRRVGGDDTDALESGLGKNGVTQAWVSSFDGLWHKDMGAVNARLARDCRRSGSGRLIPFGSINPLWPDWEEDLRRCAQDYEMRGIRLHPNYHGYSLADGRFARVLEKAAEWGLIVQLALVMEDERMMHPQFRAPPVDTSGLASLVRTLPKLRLVLLNALRPLQGQPLFELLGAGQVFVEISHLEGVGGVSRLLEEAPVERVLFGSHAPLFYFESALLKLKESLLNDAQCAAIRSGTAKKLLGS